jgi:ABC-type Zn uptake system ZnuABC Zn-binding protein ZnuA
MAKKLFPFILLIAFLFSLNACNAAPSPSEGGNQKLQVVATTTIVGDVVANIGGDAIQLTVLLPVGTDPHGFDPTPQDIAKVAEADLLIINGAGLEQFMDNLLQNAGGDTQVVDASKGIQLIQITKTDTQGNQVSKGDPHTWIDPNNVIIWVENISKALSESNPENAAVYKSNAQKYTIKLKELDTWIQNQVSEIPVGDRKLVTDHAMFGYFATRYGFEQIGAVFPGFSTMAEPAAQEIAALEDAIKAYGVKAIFVGNTINPSLANQIAKDTGIKVVTIYTGSLSESGGEAGTYLDYMRYNVSAIANALK